MCWRNPRRRLANGWEALEESPPELSSASTLPSPAAFRGGLRNGGAIALGHPLGCTGAKLTATILREMARRNTKYGLVTMCVGGGQGAAGIFERMN
jgi:acetyl-CoA acetyltransferase